MDILRENGISSDVGAALYFPSLLQREKKNEENRRNSKANSGGKNNAFVGSKRSIQISENPNRGSRGGYDDTSSDDDAERYDMYNRAVLSEGGASHQGRSGGRGYNGSNQSGYGGGLLQSYDERQRSNSGSRSLNSSSNRYNTKYNNNKYYRR